jgi:hypothetical protein
MDAIMLNLTLVPAPKLALRAKPGAALGMVAVSAGNLPTAIATARDQAIEAAQSAQLNAQQIERELSGYAPLEHTHDLGALTNVTLSKPAPGDVLVFSETTWRNQPHNELLDGGNF